MGVNIDEPRRNDLARGVDSHTGINPGKRAYGSDFVTLQGDITYIAWMTATVDDQPTLNDGIKHVSPQLPSMDTAANCIWVGTSLVVKTTQIHQIWNLHDTSATRRARSAGTRIEP